MADEREEMPVALESTRFLMRLRHAHWDLSVWNPPLPLFFYKREDVGSNPEEGKGARETRTHRREEEASNIEMSVPPLSAV